MNETIKALTKKFGEHVFVSDFNHKTATIPTGSLILEQLIGLEGFPKGRIIELFGNEASGKTTIALNVAKQCLQNKGKVVYFDAENALYLPYLQTLELDLVTKNFCLVQPQYGEQVFAIADALMKTNQVDLIIIDSVAALVPKAEIDNTMMDHSVGLHARLMAKGLRMIQATIAQTQTCVIFINQIREKIGLGYQTHLQTTTGGKALRFFSSLRLEVKKTETIKENEKATGIRVKVSVIKNKLAPPFRCGYLELYFNQGYDLNAEIFQLALALNLIERVGSWYYFANQKIAQGKTNFLIALKQQPQLQTILYQQLKSLL